MIETYGSARPIAFLIDCLVFLGLALALLYPLTQLDSDRFRIGTPLPEFGSVVTTTTRNGTTTATIGGTWVSATCETPKPVPEAVLVGILPDQVDRVLVCADKFMGLSSGHTTHVQYRLFGETQSGMQGNQKITVTKVLGSARYALSTDAAANPVRPLFPLGLMTFGLMWAVAAIGWPTPGKLITGLRVHSPEGACRPCREFRRLGPFLLAGGFTLLTGLLEVELLASPALQLAQFAAQIAFWLFALWYYAWPYLMSARAARYDMATGCRVVLA